MKISAHTSSTLSNSRPLSAACIDGWACMMCDGCDEGVYTALRSDGLVWMPCMIIQSCPWLLLQNMCDELARVSECQSE